ncbi:hypothetical protein ABIE67_009849 [Streptomyces sp. V4I8]|uniref:cupin domain-containing protein n=1 Tax=Streptomyces sp. V4I8 TaxID=3156469 RepID=UPI003513F38A
MIDTASWAERLGGVEFLTQTLFRSHKIVPGDADDVRDLLTWDALNHVLASHRIDPPRLRLSQGGEPVHHHRYTQPETTRRGVAWRRVQAAALHDRLAEGASLVVDAIDEMHPPIGAAAESLERFLCTPVQVNAYASWTAEEGFGTHWDDHDVVVVQLYGAKRWRLYGPTRQAPAWRDTEAPAAPEGPPLVDAVLKAGDILYLPRGWWHAVSADQGTPSLHLTFGLGTRIGADFLNWAVDQLRSRLAFRLDVPRFAPVEDQAAYVAQLGKELAALLDEPGILGQWARSMDTTHPGRHRPSLPYVTDVPANPFVTVRLTCPRARLADGEDGTVTLAAAGTAWDFAAPARPLLELLVAGQPIDLGDLAEWAALPLEDVAAVVSVLVKGQAAAVVGAAL